MLYKDKFGIYWEMQDVQRMSQSEKEELGIQADYTHCEDLFD